MLFRSATQYPTGQSYSPATAADTVAADLGWRQFFKEPGLQQLIQLSLENNRDLRVAALNIEAYRAKYRIQRADLLPSISADASGTRQRTPPIFRRQGVQLRQASIRRHWASVLMNWICSAACAASAKRRWKPTFPAKRPVARLKSEIGRASCRERVS